VFTSPEGGKTEGTDSTPARKRKSCDPATARREVLRNEGQEKKEQSKAGKTARGGLDLADEARKVVGQFKKGKTVGGGEQGKGQNSKGSEKGRGLRNFWYFRLKKGLGGSVVLGEKAFVR